MLTFLENGAKAINKLDNGNTIIYERHGDIYFDERTPRKVTEVLLKARQEQKQSRRRKGKIHIHFGDQETGRDWLEEWDTEGFVSASQGPLKSPILLENYGSDGGCAILTHCIVKIRDVKTGEILYQHPKYHYQTITVKQIMPIDKVGDTSLYEEGLRFGLYADKVNHANFENLIQLNEFLLNVIGHIPTTVETNFIC